MKVKTKAYQNPKSALEFKVGKEVDLPTKDGKRFTGIAYKVSRVNSTVSVMVLKEPLVKHTDRGHVVEYSIDIANIRDLKGPFPRWLANAVDKVSK